MSICKALGLESGIKVDKYGTITSLNLNFFLKFFLGFCLSLICFNIYISLISFEDNISNSREVNHLGACDRALGKTKTLLSIPVYSPHFSPVSFAAVPSFHYNPSGVG